MIRIPVITSRLVEPFVLAASLALVLALALSACDGSDAQQMFEADAAQPPSGITPTDQEGNLTGAPDPDDWRTSPLFPTIVVEPAYPNPVPAGYTGPIVINVNIPFPDNIPGLRLRIWDPRPPQRFPVVIDEVGPGNVFHFNSLSFTRSDVQAALQLADPRGLYRLYIHDGNDRLISYGDVQVD
jgi:hypothetical protein